MPLADLSVRRQVMTMKQAVLALSAVSLVAALRAETPRLARGQQRVHSSFQPRHWRAQNCAITVGRVRCYLSPPGCVGRAGRKGSQGPLRRALCSRATIAGGWGPVTRSTEPPHAGAVVTFLRHSVKILCGRVASMLGELTAAHAPPEQGHVHGGDRRPRSCPAAWADWSICAQRWKKAR